MTSQRQDPADDELRRHLHHMTVLHEVNTRIASTLDPDEVLASMLDSLGQLLAYDSAAVYLVDLDVTMPAEGPHTVVPTTTAPRLLAGRSFEGGPLHAPHGSRAGDGSMVVEAMRSQQTVCHALEPGVWELVVPLRAGGRGLGALDLRLPDALPDEDVKILELLAAAASVALQNAHLYQETQRLATTDPLTGLRNYRQFHELLNQEVQRARRMEYPLGLVIMDLDHFKLINDKHGHPAGDQALRQVADALGDRLRRTDVIARLGGEEFGAILPSTTLEEVGIVAEKIRTAVEQLPLLPDGMAITVSVGGASLAADSVDAQQLVSSADQALYQAKRNGRNQVRLWTGPPPPE
ncbi:MAG TPA: sensor domain-containing diguanylate cyclase [Chloroflexota bacterium]|nr:sensor domain-containing diguanylate cyclase [Chloroflexota bacterium]